MFAGIVKFNNDQKPTEKLIELEAASHGLAHIPYADSAYWQSEGSQQGVILVQQRQWNSIASKQQKGMVSHMPSQTRIAAWARIDNRDDLLNQLPKDLHVLGESDDGLILAAYLHWGKQACEQLVGDFSFAIFDGRDNSVYCGRDHTGVKPFYYYVDNNQFAFASSMAVLKQLPSLNLSLSEQWQANYLTNTSVDWTKTVYQNINKLPPAHTLHFSNKKLNLHRYFEFSARSDLILPSDEEYVEAYREILHQAVACRVQSAYPIGSESSGGLDSSTITALASLKMYRPGRNLHAFGYDESELTPECIIAISQRHRLAMTHFASRTRGSDENISARFEQCYGAPVEHSNAISHHIFYEHAQKLGIRTLLSGFGGDEFVTSAAPVALVEFWQSKDWRLFLSRQRGNLLTKPLHTLRWVYQYYRHHNHSTTSRQLAEGSKRSWDLRIINDTVADKYRLQEKMLRKDIYDGGKTKQNHFAIQDRWSPMMTARLDNCTIMAAQYGIDYRWPLMDIRLLKLFLSIPASQKLGPNLTGRYLHRRAVADVLPDFITWKDKDMEPFRYWQRLGLWTSRTPLVKFLKQDRIQLGQKNALDAKQAPDNKQTGANDQGFDSRIEPSLEALLDLQKLQQLHKMLGQAKLDKNQRMQLQRQLTPVIQLNSWLKAQK